MKIPRNTGHTLEHKGNCKSNSPGFYSFLCLAIHVSFSVLASLPCRFFATSSHELASPRHAEWDAKKCICRKMRPKTRKLHELQYTEMVKSGNIRLVSELTYLGTRQDRRPRSRAYTCRCTRRAGCSTPRSPRTSPPAQERRTRQYLHRKKYILRKDLSKNIFLNVKIQPGPFSRRFFLLK